jgi:hypothetical protein
MRASTPPARLWAVASAVSLPGALWRLVALRAGVRRAPARAAQEFDAGRSRLPVAEVVAGVAAPPGPDEVSAMVDAVLRGVGDGDLGVTFERAAAFARVCSVGRAVLADRSTDDVDPGPRRGPGRRAGRGPADALGLRPGPDGGRPGGLRPALATARAGLTHDPGLDHDGGVEPAVLSAR